MYIYIDVEIRASSGRNRSWGNCNQTSTADASFYEFFDFSARKVNVKGGLCDFYNIDTRQVFRQESSCLDTKLCAKNK